MSGISEAEEHPAFQPVKELFAAMSMHDGKAMKETATDDFQLLEHGEDWTMQRLIDAVQPKGKPYDRLNFFNQIQTYYGCQILVETFNFDQKSNIVAWMEMGLQI